MTAPSFVISLAVLFSISAMPYLILRQPPPPPARRENHTSKYAINCFTMTFHATNLSINTSEGLKSCGAMFFFMSDWLLLTVEPWRLAREMEVWREMDAVSFMVMGGVR